LKKAAYEISQEGLPAGMNWTVLMKLGARYYDPSVGRVISQDPIIEPRAPNSQNRAWRAQ